MPTCALVVGSVHLVIHARAGLPVGQGNRRDTISIDVGGCAYEISLSLRTMGVAPRLLTAWAASELSQLLGSHINSADIELMADEVTGMQIGGVVVQTGHTAHPQTVAATPISDHLFSSERIKAALDNVTSVYLDATLSKESLAAIAITANDLGIPVIAIGVAADCAVNLLNLPPRSMTAMVIRPEECERILEKLDLADATEIAQTLETMVFVTRAERGAVIYHPDGERSRIVPPTEDAPVSARGDAFSIGVIAGIIAGEELFDAANHAYKMVIDLEDANRLQNGFNSMVQHLVERADVDKLTGLLTRAGFSTAMARLGQRAGVMLLVDLDHFKHVNDTLGHAAGDTVLARIAAIIQSCIRADDLACRWGGDEFAVFISCTDAGQARSVATRMLELVRSAELQGVTLSIGSAVAVPGSALADVVASADAAMYLAKKSGKNRSMFADEGCDLPTKQSALHLG